jgi:hypothetical protein
MVKKPPAVSTTKTARTQGTGGGRGRRAGRGAKNLPANFQFRFVAPHEQ